MDRGSQYSSDNKRRGAPGAIGKAMHPGASVELFPLKRFLLDLKGKVIKAVANF